MNLIDCIKEGKVFGCTKNPNPIHIAFGIDNRYIIPFGIAMTSVLVNNPGSIIHLFIDKYSKEDEKRIVKTVNKYQSECHIYVVDVEKLGKLPTNQMWSKAIYYRILAARYLGRFLDKAVYLDADIFCRGKLEPFSLSIPTKYAAVVEDFAIMQDKTMREYIKQKLHIKSRYFNSGVLFINLRMWNKDNISERAIKYLLSDEVKWKFPDQDVLNILLKNNVFWLSEKYDIQLDYIKNKSLMSQVPLKSCILHFTGAKPWSEFYYPNLLHPTFFDKEYKKCYQESAWSDCEFLNPNMAFSYRKESQRCFSEKKFLLGAFYQLKYMKEKIIGKI